MATVTETPQGIPITVWIIENHFCSVNKQRFTEVITEPPKYNPSSRTVLDILDAQSENEENIEHPEEDEQNKRRRRRRDDCCYDPYDPHNDGLMLYA